MIVHKGLSVKTILISLILLSTGVFAQTPTAGVMDSANECFSLKGKPFASYQKFYFKGDGVAYGLKNGQEVKLRFDESLKAINADGAVNYVESLKNFKRANGISPDVCDASSGSVSASAGDSKSASLAGCNIKSEMDSVVLAMSWQPAFCEDKGSKPECRLSQFIAQNTYQAKNFTLHGMWPNKNSCGQNYGFCGEVKSNAKDFCEYPEVSITNHAIEKDLESVMPSKAAGSCLERHEWHKHGTCQSLDTSKYFDRAIKLLKNFNQSKTASLIRKYINKSNLKTSDLLKSLDVSFGKDASKQFVIVCKGNRLTEVQVNLTAASLDPKTDESKITIKGLLNKSASGYIRGCGNEIAIDQIGPG